MFIFYDVVFQGFYTPYYAQPFAPSLEKKSDAAFLHKSMFESLEKGEHTKVPYMSGYNTEEGSFAYDCKYYNLQLLKLVSYVHFQISKMDEPILIFMNYIQNSLYPIQ